VKPEDAGMDSERLKRLDKVIEESVRQEQTPGAVLLVMRNDQIVYQKTYGHKQTEPEKIPMEFNTVFDMASITKPVATATSAMILVERGELRLLDRVSDILPGFEPWYDKNTDERTPIRILHLLTHTSGLPPYANVTELTEKYGSPAPDSLLKHIATVERHHAPGTYFKYSCLNFITLQRVIEKISGESLADFSAEHIFEPLGMEHSGFLPDNVEIMACAPTELLEEGLLRGTVHDPLARVMMGGVSGNAGLFSTAQDLAIFSSMMLHEGIYNDVRILSPAAVRAMTRTPLGYEEFGRGLGWDLHSDYASNQGDLFGRKTYGHTGYTGTSLVIDPETGTVVILLTNRVYPDDSGSVIRLRSLVANIVAGSIIH
jgi:CubicO group peptidase (beta-lactamase class C family)